MNRIRFQHTDKARTSSYRVDYYQDGNTMPAQTFTVTGVLMTAPNTYDITLTAAQKPQVDGHYRVQVTAINALGETSSELSEPFPTQPPLSAPSNVTVLY